MKWLSDPRVVAFLRVALGAVFVAAAIPKLLDPVGFAKAIGNYRILPVEAERALALVLPPVELITGVLLIAGVMLAGAGLSVFAMLVVFTIAVGAAVVRGLDITCGCFDTEGGTKAGWGKIGENVVMTAAAFLVWRGDASWMSLSRLFGKAGDIE